MDNAPQVPTRPAGPATELRPADADPLTWVDQCPSFVRPYLRLMRADRPIGMWLLFWPCVLGLGLGAFASDRTLPDWRSLALMGAGAILMRGAGCTYNDIVDRDFDAKVARTRGRPIPSGSVSVRQAVIFAVVLCAASFLILITFNVLTIVLGVASLILVAIYPFMKRITWWPQAWLGLTFNWGALLGFTAETGRVEIAALLLYTALMFWTLGYDTIYAHQDKEDDALIGVKSSARKLGYQTKKWVYVFYVLTFSLMCLAGWLAGLGIVFAVGMFCAGLHLIWQVWHLDIDRPLQCLRIFRSNREAGALFALAVILGSVAKI